MRIAVCCSALLLGVAGCAGAPHRSGTDAAQLAACQQAADRVYEKQNRAELYETDRYDSTGRDSPFSVATVPDVPSRGLSGAFQRDTMVSDCLNASAGPAPASGGGSSEGSRPPLNSVPPPPIASP